MTSLFVYDFSTHLTERDFTIPVARTFLDPVSFLRHLKERNLDWGLSFDENTPSYEVARWSRANLKVRMEKAIEDGRLILLEGCLVGFDDIDGALDCFVRAFGTLPLIIQEYTSYALILGNPFDHPQAEAQFLLSYTGAPV